jgi:hypothetical protein
MKMATILSQSCRAMKITRDNVEELLPDIEGRRVTDILFYERGRRSSYELVIDDKSYEINYSEAEYLYGEGVLPANIIGALMEKGFHP